MISRTQDPKAEVASGIDRRQVIAAAACGALIMNANAGSEPRGIKNMDIKPHDFDAATVPGLSEKLLTSHYKNNYGGAVRRLNAIQTELAKQGADQLAGFQLNGLKREELIAHNSVVLHELYFAGLAGEATPSKALAKAIAADFGSFEAWRTEFAAIGKALSGGSGWALLTWSSRAGRLFNSWAADHTMIAAGGTPLLALDMYEHAYALDYGANAGAYVDAFLGAVRWTAANETFDSLK